MVSKIAITLVFSGIRENVMSIAFQLFNVGCPLQFRSRFLQCAQFLERDFAFRPPSGKNTNLGTCSEFVVLEQRNRVRSRNLVPHQGGLHHIRSTFILRYWFRPGQIFFYTRLYPKKTILGYPRVNASQAERYTFSQIRKHELFSIKSSSIVN